MSKRVRDRESGDFFLDARHWVDLDVDIIQGRSIHIIPFEADNKAGDKTGGAATEPNAQQSKRIHDSSFFILCSFIWGTSDSASCHATAREDENLVRGNT